ncbi:MAG: tyrosine-type recombinase/integrase [Rhodomicrobiaceae bacterium]
MPNAVKFTKPFLDKLLREKPEKQVTIWDAKQTGLCILHSPGAQHRTDATVTFQACYYLPSRPGFPRYTKIGRYGETVYYRDVYGELHELDCGDIEAVRTRCSNIRNAAKVGEDPKKPKVKNDAAELIAAYCDEMLTGKKSEAETRRIISIYIEPEWKERRLEEIKRSEVAALLQRIAKGKVERNGKTYGTPNVAGIVHQQIRSLFRWFAANRSPSDDYVSPIVEGMYNKSWSAGERNRVMSYDEIKAMWKATEEMGMAGACIRVALLTAQRFYKVGHMRRSQIENGIWDAREDGDPKNKQVSFVPLTPFTLELINSVPIIDAGRRAADFVFSTDGIKPYNGWATTKLVLDKKMSAVLGHKVPAWQFRDLRRTASTMMNSLGVDDSIVERCLAHKLGGVKGVYNRYP